MVHLRGKKKSLSIYESWWTRGMQEKLMWGWPHLLRISVHNFLVMLMSLWHQNGLPLHYCTKKPIDQNLFAKMYVKIPKLPNLCVQKKKKNQTLRDMFGVGGGNLPYIYMNIYNIYILLMQYTVCIYVRVRVCVYIYICTHANSSWKRTLNALLAKHCGVQT